MDELLDVFEAQSRACESKAASQTLLRHMLAHTLCQGRHTITGLLMAAGRQDHDWSADYRLYAGEQMDPQALFEPILQGALELLGPGQPLVVAVDDSLYRKTGKKIQGAGWHRDPLSPAFRSNLAWGLKFVQLSVLVPDPNNPRRARALPVALSIMPKLAKLPDDATKHQRQEYEQAKAENTPGAHAIRMLNRLCEQVRVCDANPQRPIRLVGDGHYTTSTVLKQLPQGVVYIGRTRKDMDLQALPSPSKRKGPGRPKAYGPQLPTPEALRKDDKVPWQTVTIEYAGAQTQVKLKRIEKAKWDKAGHKQVIQVVVIAPLRYRKTKKGRLRYTKPAFLVCTDPDMPVEELVQDYFWRWDIEVNFRDEKQLFGASHPQVRNANSIAAAPAVATAAYAGLLLATLRTYSDDNPPPVLKRPKWHQHKSHRRITTQDLLSQLRLEATMRFINFSHFTTQTGTTRNEEKIQILPISNR